MDSAETDLCASATCTVFKYPSSLGTWNVVSTDSSSADAVVWTALFRNIVITSHVVIAEIRSCFPHVSWRKDQNPALSRSWADDFSVVFPVHEISNYLFGLTRVDRIFLIAWLSQERKCKTNFSKRRCGIFILHTFWLLWA